jgi:hypothetical protein
VLVKITTKRGLVAQLVEQRTENPRVGSSILSQATIFFNSLGLPIGSPFLIWRANGVRNHKVLVKVLHKKLRKNRFYVEIGQIQNRAAFRKTAKAQET